MPTTLSEEFGASFQVCFGAFMVRDSEFLNCVVLSIEPEFFTDDSLKRLIRLVKEFYAEWGAAPGILIFHEFDRLKYAGLLSDEVHRRLNLITEELFRIELQNRDYILGQFEKFVRYQRLESSIPKIAELTKQGKFDEAEAAFKKMLEQPTRGVDLGRAYTSDVLARIQRRQLQETERCWTYIDPIDRYVKGLLPGEIMVFQSQMSSMGKTAALVMLARNFAAQKKRVLFLSLEESIDAIEDRLDQCFAGLREEELLMADVIQRRVARILNRGGARSLIHVVKLPDSGMTISSLRHVAVSVRSQLNFQYDAVVIDYADLLVADTPSLRDNMYETGREVYAGWRAWMQEDRVSGFTGMQSNRGAASEGRADQQHASGSYWKPRIADVVLTLNQDKKSAEEGRLTLFIEKNRKGIRNISLPMRTDFARQRIWVPDEPQFQPLS